MSDYTITTDFGAKDSLPSGNAAKIIKGSEFTTEFTNIKTAIATKANTVSPTFTGNTALDGATTFGANGTSTFNGTVNFTKDVTFDTNTLFVDVSENRVGIGNVAPATALDVTGVITTDGLTSSAGIDVTGTVTASGLTVDTNTLHVDATNNRVGIGTSSPDSLLHVDGGDVKISSDQNTSNGDGKPTLFFGESAADEVHAAISYHGDDVTGNDNFVGIGCSGAISKTQAQMKEIHQLVVNSVGNVGIGTTSPLHKVDITGDEDTVYDASSDSGQSNHDATLQIFNKNATDESFASLVFRNRTSGVGISRISSISKGSGTTDMAFVTENSNVKSEKLRIKADGNVGIGTSSPTTNYTKTLHIHGSGTGASLHLTDPTSGATASDGLEVFQYGNDGYIWEREAGHLRFGTSALERMRIDSSGNVLVGTTNANLYDDTSGSGIALHANGRLDLLRGSAANAIFNRLGTDGEQVIFRKNGSTVGSISVTASATAYNTSSDERLKENIQDAEDAGSKIDAIQIRQFDWKADGSHQDYGVIAQELATVAPEAVHQPEDSEEIMGVDYSKLVPMLIKEVQSLRSRVAELENI